MLVEPRLRNTRKKVFSLHYRTIFAVNCRNPLKQHSPVFPNISEYGTDEWTMKETILQDPPTLSKKTSSLIPQDCLSVQSTVNVHTEQLTWTAILGSNFQLFPGWPSLEESQHVPYLTNWTPTSSCLRARATEGKFQSKHADYIKIITIRLVQ